MGTQLLKVDGGRTEQILCACHTAARARAAPGVRGYACVVQRAPRDQRWAALQREAPFLCPTPSPAENTLAPKPTPTYNLGCNFWLGLEELPSELLEAVLFAPSEICLRAEIWSGVKLVLGTTRAGF